MTLGTIHSVKGWECDVVCVVRLNYDSTKTDEAQPAFGWSIFCRSGGGDPALADKVQAQQLEKVRLLYTAMSRARRFLSLSCALPTGRNGGEPTRRWPVATGGGP